MLEFCSTAPQHRKDKPLGLACDVTTIHRVLGCKPFGTSLPIELRSPPFCSRSRKDTMFRNPTQPQ
jgi:hypothetical protein